MDSCKAIDANRVLECKGIQPAATSWAPGRRAVFMSTFSDSVAALIEELTAQMHQAAGELQFELAARIRDEVSDLKKELRQMAQAGHA